MANAVDSGDNNYSLAEYGQLKLPSQLVRPGLQLLDHLTDQIGRERGTTETKGRATQHVPTRGRSEARLGMLSRGVYIRRTLPAGGIILARDLFRRRRPVGRANFMLLLQRPDYFSSKGMIAQLPLLDAMLATTPKNDVALIDKSYFSLSIVRRLSLSSSCVCGQRANSTSALVIISDATW